MFEEREKRAYVRAMFARIAPRYDVLNQVMTFGQHQGWRMRAARLAVEGKVAPRVLDLATGTGDFAIALESINPNASVFGLDLVPEMLERAKGKAGMERVPLLAGDAVDLPFAGETFDAITSAFMLRNVVSLERAFGEMVRVAKPGARIVALEITQPRLPLWSSLYEFYFGRVIPLLGGALSDVEAYRYLPDSLARFVSAEELAGMMRRAGLREVRYELLNLGTVAIHVGVK
ncbi:MAG TPA: ubiquinone/menaquinone biosynthesis methyltransferase [Anaerolineae bacterium]|nr:ubiquinone/menaquinone biosynthesis methyltransferase [Anaerolineae bacterium]